MMRVDDMTSSIAMRLFGDESVHNTQIQDDGSLFARALGEILIEEDSAANSAGTTITLPKADGQATPAVVASEDGAGAAGAVETNVTRRILRGKTDSSGGICNETVPDVRSAATGEFSRAVESAGAAATQSAVEEIHTPFGVFKLGAAEPRQVVDVKADSQWEAYFMTHQPAEWMYNEDSRAVFAEIYGKQALVTLDWDGTVPENVDPMWITKRAVDASGKPLPGTYSLTTGLFVTEKA
jgi:hypothetical protein